MKESFVDTRFGMNETVSAVFHRYLDSNNVAIELVGEEGPHCMASVNVPGAPLSDELVAIKNYSENEGIEQVLIEAGIIEAVPLRYLYSGWAQIPVYRMTKEAQAKAQAVPQH